MANPIAPRPTRGLPFVVRIVGGVLVVGIVIGIGLVAQRLTDDDFVLPDRVGGLAADDSAKGREFNERNSDHLSDAYDAEAVTRRYGFDSESPLLVTAVRADSGPPVPNSFEDRHELVEDGDVTCLVTDERRASPVLCQRAGGELTVRVLGSGEPDVDDIVDATNDVWEELS